MRISGNFIETILTGSLPSIIVLFALSFFIPIFSGSTVLERIYFLSGTFCLVTIATYIQMSYRKIQILEIDDSVIFIGKKKFLNSEILFIHRSHTRLLDIITFEVFHDGIMEDFSVIDKPKLFGIFGPKGSLTLNRLYHYFPDLQGKEI